MRGLVPDQAALHGLLAKVRDLGATLISVEVIDHLTESSIHPPLGRRPKLSPPQPIGESHVLPHPRDAPAHRCSSRLRNRRHPAINAAKRADIIPTSAFTQLVAPLAQILALALITALYFAFGRRAGTFGLVAYLLNAFSLAALVGVEFVINLVFAELPDHTIEALRAGTLGVALTVASITFLLGTLAFVTAMLRTPRGPRGAAGPLRRRRRTGLAPSLRPEAALDFGLVTWPSESAGSRSGCSTAPAASPPGQPPPLPKKVEQPELQLSSTLASTRRARSRRSGTWWGEITRQRGLVELRDQILTGSATPKATTKKEKSSDPGPGPNCTD